ncbi:polysaccharide deacetylase family protein [Bacillaceae bacterium SIJ1]|nr:polysaccharide deacetylase family protein [Litoribacterium kuwaitense]
MIWTGIVSLLLIVAGCQGAPATEESETTEETSEQAEASEANTPSAESDSTETTENEKSATEEDDKDESDQPAQDQEEAEAPMEPLYQINPQNYKIEPLDDAEENVVLLTIDDAPDQYALEMAKTLNSLEAPAIFFVNGHFIDTEEEKAVLKEIHEMGFAIGNHTSSHANLSDLSSEEQRDEIISVNEEIEAITGEKPVFFRAPFGVNTDTSRQIVTEEGMAWMNWSYGYDFVDGYMTKEAIGDIMVNAPELSAGANLLMHDREWTNAALEDIITGLRDKGYSLVDPELIQVNTQ